MTAPGDMQTWFSMCVPSHLGEPICSILELYEEERGSSVVQSAFLCCLGLLQVLPAILLRHHLLEMRNVPGDDCSNCRCVECGGLLTARFAPALAG